MESGPVNSFTPYLAFYLVTGVIVYFVVYAWIRSSRLRKRRKADEIMTCIYKTGKIIYENRVYTVKDICEGRSPVKGKKPSRYLVVSKNSGREIYKIPLDSVSPYYETNPANRRFLYK